MKTINLVNMDLTITYEKLSNGLEIYAIPKENTNNIYATFTTKYGSKINEFIPMGKKEMIKVPLGIAHFLEHKLFEQKDAIDPFAFYSERGADCNANTSKERTTYLFSGTDNYADNLNFLLDYVQEPYFTDANVLKEKGIIEQEIKMYEDKPFWVMLDGITLNTIKNDPFRYPIAGTVESINKITKEDLYNCYNTFYHPSNMILVVTGNIDSIDTINIIKANQDKKQFSKQTSLKIKEYKEDKRVVKEFEIKNMDIEIPKFAINYKIDISKYLENKVKFEYYLSIFVDNALGITSVFSEKMKKKGYINFDLDFNLEYANKYLLLTIIGESIKPEELIKEIKKEINKINIDEKDLERKKKMLKASTIYMSDNIFGINNKIVNNIIKYGMVINDNYKVIDSLNILDCNNILKNIDLSNNTSFIIMPKNK